MDHSKEFGKFSFSGDTTKRNLVVYLIFASSRIEENANYIYVGKTGDNRIGCNPIISRIGNHFSFNKIHSQFRNKLSIKSEDCSYQCFFSSFLKYSSSIERDDINMINQMERCLNKLIQEKISNSNQFKLLNPLKGNGNIKKEEEEKRNAYLTKERKSKLENFVKFAFENFNK